MSEAFGSVLGEHPRIREAIARARAVAPTSATVLLLGETGTGKGVLAAAIHAASGRKGRFVAVNCGALPPSLLESELFGHERGAFTGATARREGKFEAARDGTLFLDEVDALGPSAQVALLRLLQERTVERIGSNEPIRLDVRVIAATNRDLAAEVRSGRFRRDLYYRLNVVPIELPPLRERPGDIDALAHHFLREHAASLGRPECRAIAPGVLAALRAHRWPGNVRELENAILRAIILGRGPVLDRVDLAADRLDGESSEAVPAIAGAHAGVDLEGPCREHALDLDLPLHEVRRRALDAVEAAYLRGALARAGGDVDRAAQKAQLSRRMFYQLLRRYGIRPAEFRHPETRRAEHGQTEIPATAAPSSFSALIPQHAKEDLRCSA